MKIKKILNRVTAIVSATALIIACTPVLMQSIAEETTTAVQETKTNTETTIVSKTEENSESEGGTDWYKADISSYDDSISLISYEVSPEIGNDGVANEEELENKVRQIVTPTPVELNVTGGYVGDIPYADQVPYIDAQPGQFAIVTYGWGHGVGLSQNGANFYATYSGWTYQDILFHYYPGTYLMNTGTAEDEEITIAGYSADTLTQISQIVYAEVGGYMNYEAIKAQAVAAYTYCKYHGDDAADLRGRANPPQIVIDACTEVLGEALYYGEDFALTMFSASSGGITANCYEVFYDDIPYLRSVSSDYDAPLDPHYGTVTYFSDSYIRNMIESNYDITLSDDPANWIQPIYSDTTGYVTYVNIDNQLTVKGYDFKMDMGLKAPKFTVYYSYRYYDDVTTDYTETSSDIAETSEQPSNNSDNEHDDNNTYETTTEPTTVYEDYTDQDYYYEDYYDYSYNYYEW